MKQACVIIDDPLLKQNYGFLNYGRLLAAMERFNFCSSIAFIPWNYKRTDPRIAELFKDHPDRFSLCVHGCNHTKCEFGSMDGKRMHYLAGLALEKMKWHQEITGVPFDKVMVFPQGEFSKESMIALKVNGYLAAVNHIVPKDASFSSGAIMDFGIPLLVRRHINFMDDIVSDLSNGRPALIMLHHNSFRRGYDEVGRALETINKFGDIQWKKLGDIVKNLFPERSAEMVPEFKEQRMGNGIRIFLRRHCCELRDNHISNSKVLSYIINKVHSKGKRLIDY